MKNAEIIEKQYLQLLKEDQNKIKKTKQLGIYVVLMYLLEKTNPQKNWFFAWELVGKATRDGYWLSHRAPARASDLAIYHPDVVEDRKIGNQCVYRVRIENMDAIDKFIRYHRK